MIKMLRLIIIIAHLNTFYCKTSFMGNYIIRPTTFIICPNNTRPYTNADFAIWTTKDSQGKVMIFKNLTLRKDVGPIIGSAEVMNRVGGKLVKTIDIVQKPLCKYPITIKALGFNIDNENNKCVFKKGTYLDKEGDLDGLFHRLAGNKFVYGTQMIHYELYTKKEQVMCIDIVLEVVPK